MFCTDSMPRSHDATFEKRERRFHGISMNFPLDINLGFVLNPLMLLCRHSGLCHSVRIDWVLIGDQNIYVLGDVLADVRCNRSLFNIGSMEKSKIAVTLADSNYDLLFIVPESRLALAAVHLSPDIGFVHFDY